MISQRNVHILFVIFAYVASQQNVNAFEMPTDEKYKAGEKSLRDFKAKAENSDCWKKAISNLEVGCKKLTDIEQSYLAVDFTNCHLKKSGRKTYNCSREKSIEECTGNMEDVAFSTYTQFFTHTTNICFYLQSQAWQERTELTVSKLSKASEEVVGQLENSLKNQMAVLRHQNQSLRNQKEIISHEQKLTLTLKSSTTQAKQAFDEMKTKANEQKAIFSETFEGIFKSVESIKQLQAMILGEFITLQSLAFHFVAVCLCYFFTSCPRTASARLGLFVGLVILIGMERVVTSSSIGDGQSTDAELVHFRLWLCRKIYILVATLGLLVTAYRYQDLNKINHCLLQEIQQQIRELKRIQPLESANTMKAITDGAPMTKGLAISQSWASFQHSSFTSQKSDNIDGQANEKTDENDASYDETYIPEDTLVDHSSSESEYESICSENITDISNIPLNDQSVNTSKSAKKRRSSGISTSTPQHSKSKLMNSRSDVTPHRYNLRPRKSGHSNPLNYQDNSFNMPSPSTLAELVQTLKQSTKQYTAVKKKRDRHSRKELFSSDDEI